MVTNQVLYNLTRRNIEHSLLPWCLQHRVPIMAYSPVEQGRLLHNGKLTDMARARDSTPAQIAIAWLLAQPDVIAIPKAGDLQHVEENRAAADIELTSGELEALDQIFPRPQKRRPLEML